MVVTRTLVLGKKSKGVGQGGGPRGQTPVTPRPLFSPPHSFNSTTTPLKQKPQFSSYVIGNIDVIPKKDISNTRQWSPIINSDRREMENGE
jgi:hypothetical protein